MRKIVLPLSIALMAHVAGHSQLSTLCNNAGPLCASVGVTYNNLTGDPPGTPGLGSFNCLGTTPNANMFYMQVGNSGPIHLTLSQTSGDVDFMLWGPFASPSAGCAAIVANPSQNNVDCSYSTASVEAVDIPNGVTGQYYLLLVTNYANQPGTISVIQTSGTGTTNCGILSNAQNNGPVCINQPLLLDGSGSTVGNGTGPFSYNWYLLPDMNTPISSSQNFSFNAPAPGTYNFMLVTMDVGTFEADTAYTTGIVNPIPAAPTFTSTAPACEGSTVTLTPDNIISGATYQWSGTNGFTSNQTVATFANANPAIFNADYTLVVTVNGCTSPPYTEPLVIYDTNVPTVSGPTEECEGVLVPLDVTNGDLFVSFAWNNVSGSDPQMVVPGTYTVTATDSNGCQTTSAPFSINIIPNPLSIIGDTTYCEGAQVTLSATPGKQSYSWSTGSTQESTQVTGEGYVSVSVVSTDGCVRSDSVYMVRYAKPEALFSPDKACQGTTVDFSNVSTLSDNHGSVQNVWIWNFGHIDPSGTTPAIVAEEEPTHIFPGPGTYNITFVVGSNYGCYDTLVHPFTVATPPQPNFAFESFCFGEGHFTNLTTPGTYPLQSQTMAWDFGDGTSETNNDNEVYHAYPSISTYTVTLTATDSAGCTADTTIDITLKITPMFEDIPNVITPNGDGVNDFYAFIPEIGDCYNYTFAVFNRWGTKVFETEGAGTKPFDGKSNLGSKLQDGTYFWVLIAHGIGQEDHITKSGSITIAGTK